MSLFFSLGVILGALLVSSLGGWGVVVLILSWARVPALPEDRSSSPDGRPAAILRSAASSSPALMRGGMGRWSELRDNPGFNERFIIGALASLTWAGTCGLLGRYALERFIWFGP